MSPRPTRHLTDAEFSDLLAGEAPREAVRLHLLGCDHCRGELESVRDSMASFAGISTRWAQVVAPGRIPVPPRWALRFWAVPSWSTGLAMTALTGLLVFHFDPMNHLGKQTVSAAPIAAPAPSKTELANDNRLMLSIDQELGYPEQTRAPGTVLRSDARETVQIRLRPVVN